MSRHTEGALTRPSPLLSLPVETLDRILSFAVPTTLSSRVQRRQLSTYLLVHPAITPLVRRRLYNKLTVILGDSRESDLKLLELLESTSTHAQHFVGYLKVRVPDPDPKKQFEDLTEDPALAFLPCAVLDQNETVKRVATAFQHVPRLQYVELDAQVGTVTEGQERSGFAGQDHLEQLEQSMQRWHATLHTFIFACADPYQRLQVYADCDLDYRSPFVGALQSWAALTHLNLWLVRFKLPAQTSTPTFRLKSLRLKDVEMTSDCELEWFLGTLDDLRSAQLESLMLQDLVFTSHPSSSTPLLSALIPKGKPPAFAQTLKHLELHLLHPLGDPTPSRTLSSLTSLETLLLGGAGIDLSLFASVFPPLDDRGFKPVPSHTLRTLTLNYLIDPSLRNSGYEPLLDLPPYTFHTTLFSHLLTPHSVPRLEAITFQPIGRFPRKWTWAQRRGIALPTWSLQSGCSSWSEPDAWFELESPLRRVNRLRRREQLQSGGGGGQADPGTIQLLKNRAEIEYAEDESDRDGQEEEEEEDEVPFDGDALFVPSSEDEGPVVVGRAADQDSDSDF
ncbi:uncharacterized protein JCM15063_002416 [Sporobolomyces koalae]|uniref:uncharacterized protein n=1 Tax=Sporobolomyces koalae TaxID=500713 RepID=UPI003180AEB5